MKKKVFSLLFVAMFGCLVYSPAVSVYAEEGVESGDVSRDSLFFETDVITQKDYEEGFQNYALSDATVDFAAEIQTFTNTTLANVVGVVRDYNTEELIPNATISVDGEDVIVTGSDGRFQLKNFPSGTYSWEISAPEYYTAEYSGYDVDYADGTTIFTFYISDDFAISQDREDIIHAQEREQTVPYDVIEQGNCMTSSTARSMNSVPNVSNTVKVYYNDATRSVNRQTYIYTVVYSELYATSFYTNLGLTLAQTKELYQAQAIAANTFLEYSLKVYSNHSSSSYNVCATHCCQVYDPTKITQAAIDAAAKIFYTAGSVTRTDIVMYKSSPTTYDYIWGAFFSYCDNKGIENHSTQPALKAVSCTDITKGATSPRHYGLCQMGAATRAKNGKTASDILMYYYSNCCIASCPLN